MYATYSGACCSYFYCYGSVVASVAVDFLDERCVVLLVFVLVLMLLFLMYGL